MRKATRKALEKKVVEGLYDHLSQYGYQIHRVREEFVFKNELCDVIVFQRGTPPDSIIIGLKYHFHHQFIEALIERIMNQTSPAWMRNAYFYNASEKEHGGKISEMVHNPQFNEPIRYWIENEIDVMKIVKYQNKYFDKVVLKYIEHFKSLESIYTFLSPYLLDLTEAELETKESSNILQGYLSANEYWSLMISSWMTHRSEYDEVFRRLKKIFEHQFIYPSYVLLDKILKEEYP